MEEAETRLAFKDGSLHIGKGRMSEECTWRAYEALTPHAEYGQACKGRQLQPCTNVTAETWRKHTYCDACNVDRLGSEWYFASSKRLRGNSKAT